MLSGQYQILCSVQGGSNLSLILSCRVVGQLIYLHFVHLLHVLQVQSELLCLLHLLPVHLIRNIVIDNLGLIRSYRQHCVVFLL